MTIADNCRGVRGDSAAAFLTLGDPLIHGFPEGPLSGLTFGLKDLFNVEGQVTGCGNPDWASSHGPAERTAAAVARLLAAGATLVGKTHTDELAYSLNGENYHYGTPHNLKAPDRVPGGSSSGSAAAVAAGLCDFAIGTDTGGSVRIPASYCGIFGMRPSHGRITLDGCMPLAPSFDTLGWFTNDCLLLQKLGRVLFETPDCAPAMPSVLLVPEDALALCDAEVAERFDDALTGLNSAIGTTSQVTLARDLSAWCDAARVLQGAEVWRTHGAWISSVHPTFGPDVRERFVWAAALTEEQISQAQALREDAASRMQNLLSQGTVLVMPTAPCVAPHLGLTQEALAPVRRRILSLTCIAGLAGLPQVSIPLPERHALPIGLSLIGWRGTDERLLALGAHVATLLAAS